MIFSNPTAYPKLSTLKHLKDITKKYKDVEVELQFYEVILDQYNTRSYDISRFSGLNRVQVQGFVKGSKRGISFRAPFIVKMPFNDSPKDDKGFEDLFAHYMGKLEVLQRIDSTVEMVNNVLGDDELSVMSVPKNIAEASRKIYFPSINPDTYKVLKTDSDMLRSIGTLSIIDYWATPEDPEYYLEYASGFKYLDVPEGSLKVLGSIIRAIDEDELVPNNFDACYRGTMLNLYGPFSERVKFSHGPKWGITLEYASCLEGDKAGNNSMYYSDGDVVKFVYNINTYYNDVKYDNTLLARSFTYSSWDSEESTFFEVSKAEKRVEVFVSADEPIIVDLGRRYD